MSTMRGAADLAQFINNHLTVKPAEYADPNGKIRIPPPEELPNLDLEVVNFHRPVFGTFHSKYMVVDRRIAIVQSNNIQDIDNMEMMTQFEGPIVDSFYDVALISWHNALKPPLPLLDRPAAGGPMPTFDTGAHATLFDQDGKLTPVYHAYVSPLSREIPLTVLKNHPCPRWDQQPERDRRPRLPGGLAPAHVPRSALRSGHQIRGLTRRRNIEPKERRETHRPHHAPS